MPFEGLTFRVTSAELQLQRTTGQVEEQSLLLHLEDTSPFAILDQASKSLNLSVWAMYLAQEPLDESETDIGSLSYSERVGRPVCMFSLSCTSDAFGSLLKSIQAGRLPNQVTVMLDGLQRQEDGVVWNTAAMAKLQVLEVEFTVPLATTS